MDTYTTEPDGLGGFQVVTWHSTGKRENVVTGYATQEAADAWIAARRDLAATVDQAKEDRAARDFGYLWRDN